MDYLTTLTDDSQLVQQAILLSQKEKELLQSQYLNEHKDNNKISLMYFQNTNCDDIQISTNRVTLKAHFGTLLKKSPHWIQGYKERHCSLLNRIFRYYNIDNKKLEGVLNFDILSYDLLTILDKFGQISEFILKPHGNIEKTFQFKGITQQETNYWFNLIQVHLCESFGKKQEIISLSKYERFWRHERISSQQLQEQAEDGDIILFRGKDFGCKIQRAFTQDDYDHVGLLIRLENDNLYIFEALPQNGVGLCKWTTFNQKKWYNLYDKVVYRKLNVRKSFDFKAKLCNFVNQNLGKKYSITPSKLLMQKSTVLNDSILQAAKEKTRTYFCSELIAYCYKQLGFLPQELSSTQYWPGSFSQNKNLKLIDGHLSEEFLIDFQM